MNSGLGNGDRPHHSKSKSSSSSGVAFATSQEQSDGNIVISAHWNIELDSIDKDEHHKWVNKELDHGAVYRKDRKQLIYQNQSDKDIAERTKAAFSGDVTEIICDPNIFTEESINVSCIFENPENKDALQIIHREVANGIPSNELFRKPYGWLSKTVITFAVDGTVKKSDVTKWKCLLVSGTERSSIDGIIEGGKLEILSKKRVGEGNDGKLNSFSKKTDLSNECKLEFQNGVVITYNTKFIIVDPEKHLQGGGLTS